MLNRSESLYSHWVQIERGKIRLFFGKQTSLHVRMKSSSLTEVWLFIQTRKRDYSLNDSVRQLLLQELT